MSTISLQDTHHHDNHDDHGHGHHHETFLTKYIFSQDHKMIAKQFLITGIIMAVIAMALSILFRLQLAWPDKSFPNLRNISR
jgi:cytochrome c oxidase subunit 1